MMSGGLARRLLCLENGMCGGLWWVDGFLCVGFVFGRPDCVYCMVTFILYMHKYVDCVNVLCCVYYIQAVLL